MGRTVEKQSNITTNIYVVQQDTQCGLDLLETKRNLLYIRNQAVPRSKFHHGYKNKSFNDV